MRSTGTPWETDDGKTQLEQTAAFLPKGLGGLLYW